LSYKLKNDDGIPQQLALKHVSNEIAWGLVIAHERCLSEPWGSSSEHESKHENVRDAFNFNPTVFVCTVWDSDDSESGKHTRKHGAKAKTRPEGATAEVVGG